MAQQRQDYLVVDGKARRIAAAAPMPFAPSEYGLRLPIIRDANCSRGFWVDYELVEDSLTIKELHLTTHKDDLRQLAQGQLFGHEPSKIAGLIATYEGVRLDYSGSLIVDLATEFSDARSQRHVWRGDAPTHERFDFYKGRLTLRAEQRLSELPDGFTPSSVWLDYGSMLWIRPAHLDAKKTKA